MWGGGVVFCVGSPIPSDPPIDTSYLIPSPLQPTKQHRRHPSPSSAADAADGFLISPLERTPGKWRRAEGAAPWQVCMWMRETKQRRMDGPALSFCVYMYVSLDRPRDGTTIPRYRTHPSDNTTPHHPTTTTKTVLRGRGHPLFPFQHHQHQQQPPPPPAYMAPPFRLRPGPGPGHPPPRPRDAEGRVRSRPRQGRGGGGGGREPQADRLLRRADAAGGGEAEGGGGGGGWWGRGDVVHVLSAGEVSGGEVCTSHGCVVPVYIP